MMFIKARNLLPGDICILAVGSHINHGEEQVMLCISTVKAKIPGITTLSLTSLVSITFLCCNISSNNDIIHLLLNKHAIIEKIADSDHHNL